MDRWAAMRFEMGGVPVIRRGDLRVEDDPEHDLDGPDPFAADSLDAAWADAEAAVPEGWDLMVGHTSECSACIGWWATASERLKEPPYYPRIVSSENGRPRGEHHDDTPAAALRALAAKLRERQP